MEAEGIANGYHTEQEPVKNLVGESEAASQPPTSANGCFDCNICLDFAVDPVVTLCGHLYCWPCIYKWLHIERDSVQQCPVCKASLDDDSLVPLYGRGHNTTKRSQQSFDIPQRPNSSFCHRGHTETEGEGSHSYNHQQRHYHVHQHEHHHHYPYVPLPPSSPSFGMSSSRAIHSMAIAVLPWIFPNQQEASMQLSSPGPYYIGVNGGSPRLRRQEMEVESSLHQIWAFLFCCAILCLLLF